MRNIIGKLCLVTVLTNVRYANGLDPLVETDVGLIKGLQATDGEYSMFLGIPYAVVDPVNPFGPSTPNPSFNVTFEAYDDPAKCPQFDTSINAAIGTIDCLHLNIYVPHSASKQNLLPVMVSIHGGGFNTGFGSRYVYGPKFLVRHDIILVTLNYRPGVYGFMCLGTPEVPGNQGLKDQVIALRWVKDHIKSFGGNASRVTIMGESAGGRSVDFHLMAKDENLFNKAILQSGNSMSPPGVGEVNTEVPIIIASSLGFQTNDFRDALAFLTTMDSNLLISTINQLGITFQACVEKQLDGVDVFVPDFTINRNISKVSTTPILMGFNNNERYFAHALRDNSYYEGLDFFSDFLRNYFTFDDARLAEMETLVRTFYIGDEEISEDVKQQLSDFDSDFTYNHPTHRRIANYISNGAEKIYYYMFSYDSERNYMKNRYNITVTGAVHADELSYLFDMEFLKNTLSPEDQVMIDRMTTMWTNFAKYGDPTPVTTDLLPVKWEPISESNRYYYDIDKELSLKRRPLNHRMAFLDLFFKMNEDFVKGYRKTD